MRCQTLSVLKTFLKMVTNLRVIFFFLLVSYGHGESPEMSVVGSDFVYANLKVGDSREVVLQKLRDNEFIQIYEERDKELVKCTVRWNGFRYELNCKLKEGKLELCLIEGQKGWHSTFFDDVVFPQWKNLRERLVKRFGESRSKSKFPTYDQIPLDDLGGVVTDSWDLQDRLVVLTVRSFETMDCCTEQMIEYSCCTLLIQPK